MSIHRSYFSKNNTIVANSKVNTAKNPVTQLFFGQNAQGKCKFTGLSGDTCQGNTGFTTSMVEGYSRFIFDVNLDDLKEKYNSCCLDLGTVKYHGVRMTNTSNFDDTLINDRILVNDTRRATSFDLMLFKVTGNTWDEGVGYDYLVPPGMFEPEFDTTYSIRPSNWFSSTTINTWLVDGTYNNLNPFSYQVLATQHFDNGNENIFFTSATLTHEINHLITGTTSSTTGITYGIAFVPAFENLSGLTEAYSVGFFTKYTQTFFEPFVETLYDDYVVDNRSNFTLGKTNNLFLYVYDYNGQPICLDSLPTVDILDCNGVIVATPTVNFLTCGVYYISLTWASITQSTPVLFEDVWSNISINGIAQPNVTNEFIVYENSFSVGPTAGQPKVYGYSVSGIKEDEKITNGDTRKVFVSTRVPYTTEAQVLVDNLQYRLYVTQGTTQVEVIPWTPVNMSFTSNYFLLDTGWMIPNEYYLDIKATSNQQVDTYRKVIKFQVVNQL